MKALLLNIIPTLLLVLIGIYLVKGNEAEFTNQVSSVSERLFKLESKIDHLSIKLNNEKTLAPVTSTGLEEESIEATSTVGNKIEARLVMIEYQISSLLEKVNKETAPVDNNPVRASPSATPATAPRTASPEEREERRQNQIQKLENTLTSLPLDQTVIEVVKSKVEAVRSSNEMLSTLNNFEASCNNGMCKVEYETAAGEELSPDIVENEIAIALSAEFPVSQMGTIVRTESGYKYTAYFIAPSEDEPNQQK